MTPSSDTGPARRATSAVFVLTAVLAATGVAPSFALLVATVAVFALANSVIDVAMNVQGVERERRHGRPVSPGLHAAGSLGLVGGGVAGFTVFALGPAAGRLATGRLLDRYGLRWTVQAAGLVVVAGTVLAAVTTVGYLGSFSGPLIVGPLADLTSLSVAIGVVAVAGLATTALGRTAAAFRPPQQLSAPRPAPAVESRTRRDECGASGKKQVTVVVVQERATPPPIPRRRAHVQPHRSSLHRSP
ncbi:MFS transporter [Jiangella rhizosphaerae]|uniref:MFS transporter n=1 Tax=Jiangella rhizosphaerae TaxID=2293569 RepID=A0A418KLA8_9ACTN|nr:MFS transporter [Jiangella rhizosphaerae]RIQ18312.1 MFS transporter [Jiangella rhizosphaerae]